MLKIHEMRMLLSRLRRRGKEEEEKFKDIILARCQKFRKEIETR